MPRRKSSSNCRSLTPKICPNGQKNLLSHQMPTAETLMQKEIFAKKVKQIVKACSTWAEVLQRLEKTFPVYETDLSVRTQIEELPMLPEFPSAARVSEYVCDLEYLFSRMNVRSYGATEPHLWLMSKIPQRTWDDCRSTSERKSWTHLYDELVDLLIELALERENDSDMEKFLKKHLGRGGNPTPERGEGKGPKNPTNANQGGGKGRGHLRAMNEVKPDAGTPPLFYCKPVNDKGGPCHAPDCDHRSSCMLQMKRQQHTKDGKPVTHQDHFRCTITCGYCGKRRHYEDECHITKHESDKLKRQEAERQKTQTPTKNPQNGDKGGKGGGKGVGKGGPPNPQRRSSAPESFIVISTLGVCCAPLAACCWCRVSSCLFLMRKMFYLLKYNQSRISQARDKHVEENQDQSMKGCSVNSERCKNIHRNRNSRQIGSHIHKDS